MFEGNAVRKEVDVGENRPNSLILVIHMCAHVQLWIIYSFMCVGDVIQEAHIF